MENSDQKDPKLGKGRDKDSVIVVVNGAATTVAIYGNPSLREVIEEALEQTQNSGQPVENWELRDVTGLPLDDLSVKIKKVDLGEDARLFLNLRAGIGG